MSSPVLDEAARIAREFDYPAEEVQRGVKEYIREMEEGLSKEGATLSQIPTYVTSVPNGTEKVPQSHPHGHCRAARHNADDASRRASTWPWILAAPTSACAQLISMGTPPSPSPSRR
jgi:hypothetical protein